MPHPRVISFTVTAEQAIPEKKPRPPALYYTPFTRPSPTEIVEFVKRREEMLRRLREKEEEEKRRKAQQARQQQQRKESGKKPIIIEWPLPENVYVAEICPANSTTCRQQQQQQRVVHQSVTVEQKQVEVSYRVQGSKEEVEKAMEELQKKLSPLVVHA